MKSPTKNHNRWSDEEERLLSQLYPKGDRADILSAFPNRSWSSISKKAQELRLKRRNDCWTPEEKKLLAEIYPTGSRSDILAAFLNRSWYSISTKASQLGIERSPYGASRWTEQEEQILAEMYGSFDCTAILAALPNRTWDSIRIRASQLNIVASTVTVENPIIQKFFSSYFKSICLPNSESHRQYKAQCIKAFQDVLGISASYARNLTCNNFDQLSEKHLLRLQLWLSEYKRKQQTALLQQQVKEREQAIRSLQARVTRLEVGRVA
jgi:hypothetical protein